MRRTLLAILLAAALLGSSVMWNRLLDRLIFHPRRGVDVALQQHATDGQEVFLDTEDGVRIHAFLIPSAGASRALLFLHGNSGNASLRLPNAAALASLGTEVLLLDYRGYGLSEGKPTEPGVYADARAGLRHLIDERGFPEERVVVFGRSLGGAMAVDLAQDRPLAGLIVESTFTSIPDMARTILPPAAPLVPNRFDSLGKIDRLRAPLLAFHGDRDEVVPYALGRELFEAAPEPKAFETLVGAGHNDTTLIGGAPYFERIRRFLDQVAPLREGAATAGADPNRGPAAQPL